jgi:hypothetical protein
MNEPTRPSNTTPNLPIPPMPVGRMEPRSRKPGNPSTGALVSAVCMVISSSIMTLSVIVAILDMNHRWGPLRVAFISESFFFVSFGLFLVLLIRLISNGSTSGVAMSSRAASVVSATIIFLASILAIAHNDSFFNDRYFYTQGIIPAFFVLASLGITLFSLGRLIVEGEEVPRYRTPIILCATLLLAFFALNGLFTFVNNLVTYNSFFFKATEITHSFSFITFGVLILLVTKFVSDKSPTTNNGKPSFYCSIISVALISIKQLLSLIIVFQNHSSIGLDKAQWIFYALSLASLSATFVLLVRPISKVYYRDVLIPIYSPPPILPQGIPVPPISQSIEIE